MVDHAESTAVLLNILQSLSDKTAAQEVEDKNPTVIVVNFLKDLEIRSQLAASGSHTSIALDLVSWSRHATNIGLPRILNHGGLNLAEVLFFEEVARAVDDT